jgi:hypothetical protein
MISINISFGKLSGRINLFYLIMNRTTEDLIDDYVDELVMFEGGIGA